VIRRRRPDAYARGMKLLRRAAVPEVVRAVDLPEGERRLAWGVTQTGAAVVASPSVLVLPDGTSLPWVHVEKAVYAPPVLTVSEVAEIEGSGAQHVLRLAQDHDLAGVVRARVTSSVGWSDRRRLHPRGSVRLVGRRVAGQDALLWQLVFDRDSDPDDPAVRAQAGQLLNEVRRTLG